MPLWMWSFSLLNSFFQTTFYIIAYTFQKLCTNNRFHNAKQQHITYLWVKPDLLSVWVECEWLCNGCFLLLYGSLQCDVAFCFTFISFFDFKLSNRRWRRSRGHTRRHTLFQGLYFVQYKANMQQQSLLAIKFQCSKPSSPRQCRY